jgi:protein-tyrosine phosphatase
MPRPRGGDWLEDEIQSWRQAGVAAVLSLLTREEIDELSLSHEEGLARANGLQYLSFPVPDRDVPSSKEAFYNLIVKLAEQLAEGRNVAVHCRQGIGRAGLVAACLLILSGMDPEAAIRQVSAARACPVPETPEQQQWTMGFAKWMLTQLPKRSGGRYKPASPNLS